MSNHSPKLGELLRSYDDIQRDAVHVAIAPVFSDEKLLPGQKVILAPGCIERVIACPEMIQPIGVVDPFLDHGVTPGKRFWMVLYPGTVTNLRHEWDHPDMPKPEPEEPVVEDDGCRGC